jgi:hypothetical protein
MKNDCCDSDAKYTLNMNNRLSPEWSWNDNEFIESFHDNSYVGVCWHDVSEVFDDIHERMRELKRSSLSEFQRSEIVSLVERYLMFLELMVFKLKNTETS